jgi:membrane fusion protein, heavy metal efflux system
MRISYLLFAVCCSPFTTAAVAQEPPRIQRPPDVKCAKVEQVIKLDSPDIARHAGFEYAQVSSQPLGATLTRNAEIAYNGNRYAKLSSRAPGIIAEVHKDLGERVKAGEPIAVIDSTELGAAKAEYLQSLELLALWETNTAREKEMIDRGAGNQRSLLDTQTKLAETRIAAAKARQRLRTLGLTDAQIESVQKTADTGSLLELLAPFDGLIVERAAVVGEVVEPTKPLLSVADTALMWAMIDLREQDLAGTRPGQSVTVTVDGFPGEAFAGKLTWISTQLDPRTRTIKGRAELDNGAGQLRAGMYARATISGGSAASAVLIPRDAVQWEGCCNIVFTKRDDATFKPMAVSLGRETPRGYEVLAGLTGGETIVTRGSYLLKTEILKSSIGAGCCEVDHLAK